MKTRLLLLSLAFFMLGTLYAKDSWVLVMNEHFVKKDIIHLTRPITNIHNPYFIKERGRYLLLVADDSTKLATFYNSYMIEIKPQSFPYSIFEYNTRSGEEYFIPNYDDTIFKPELDRRVFIIEGHWMSYINLDNNKYCQWEFFTKNNAINGRLTQYYRKGNLCQYITYLNGVKEGTRLTLRMNGDTVCFGQYQQGICVQESCYDKQKKLEFYTSIKDQVFRAIDSADTREYQINSLGNFDGLYKKVGNNGKVIEEGKYKDNQRDGLWKYYDSHGRVIKTEYTMKIN